MTSSKRRLPHGQAQLRLSPRTRAAVTAMRAGRHRKSPGGLPIGRVLVAVIVALVIGIGSAGGTAIVVGTGVIGSLAEGLPDPTTLTGLSFSQPTIIYDRTGTVELARFEREKRRVVSYAQVPRLILDTTTIAEDRTFWVNTGFDPAAIAAAAVQNASDEESGERGASTITQQLVRARLLPTEVLESDDRYMRKVLEVIQAARLTAAYPGEAGKEAIITAYLNEIYYGHQAYGVAAAAAVYFGVHDLDQLTPAQAALLAGLPKAPSVYDPYRYAVEDAEGRLVVPKASPPVVRRDYVLRGMHESRWSTLTPSQLEAALDEPVILAGDQPRRMLADHFSWAVRTELERIFGGREAVETGGYRVITTLDWEAQQLAEKFAYAAAIIPQLPAGQAEKEMDRLKLTRADRTWVTRLRGKDLNNSAITMVDYRTGDVLAYVGSAGYDRKDLANRRFQPEFDVASAYRQPGSAFKPIVYATAFEERVLTAGSMLLDISTDFGGWTPKNADRMDRGPVRVRQALQMSLNLPAIRGLERVGNEPVGDVAEGLGVKFLNGHDAFLQSGLAGSIGTVETRPIDLTAAFGSLGNGGVHVPTRMVLSAEGPDGRAAYTAPEPEGTRALSEQSAFLVTDILAGNTDPNENIYWAETLAVRNGPDGERRPAAVKTGTTDNNMDFGAYGYLAPPKNDDAPAIAVGVWMGNSDNSVPRTSSPPTSLAASGEVWHSFVRDYTKKWPVADFKVPNGVVQATIDRWSGGTPGPWTRDTVREWFLKGTEPGGRRQIDQAGLLYSSGCGGWVVDPVKAELGPDRWLDDIAAWVSRARRGPGVSGPYGSTTAYWFGASTWGGPLAGPCFQPRPVEGGGEGEEDEDNPRKPDVPKPDKPKPDKPKPDKPPPPPDNAPPPA